MTAPWLVLVESNTTATGPLFARAARHLGLEPVLLTTDPGRYPWVQHDDVPTRILDTGRVPLVAAACERLERERPIEGVLSSSDHYLVVAAEVAWARDLPGPRADGLRACRDKRRQRALLRRAGVLQPRSLPATTPAQAARAAAWLGPPVVVKPVDGTGSEAVRRCDDPDGAADHAAEVLARPADERGLPREPAVLVEELVEGPEVSVETFDRGLVGVTAKHLGTPPHFVEVGHDFPAPLPPGEVALAGATVRRALRALGLHWGPAHSELRRTPRGYALIEVNPRLAGGNIPRLVELATGLDLVLATVARAAGRRGPRTETGERAGWPAAAIRFLLPAAPGRLLRIDGRERAGGIPGVVEVVLTARAGDELGGHGSFRDRAGHVLSVGDTAAAAGAAADRGCGAIRLVLDPCAGPGVGDVAGARVGDVAGGRLLVGSGG